VNRNSIPIVALIGFLSSAGSAQEPPLRHFAVASIKERAFTPGRMGVGFRPGGRMVSEMAPVQLLLAVAYGLQEKQIEFTAGVSAEVLKAFYDIEAVPDPDAIPSLGDSRVQREFLQSLLADRFQLRVHTEKRELPVYAMVVAKGGLKLQKSPARDCAAQPSPCRWLKAGPGSGFTGQSVNLQSLAEMLSLFQERTVLDQTHIEGRFDIDLAPFSRGAATPGTVIDGVPADLVAPALSTVLQAAGLRLEPQKQLLDVLIVDHLETPAPN
jgi:uncharacterized protein (TIGR03435 family)